MSFLSYFWNSTPSTLPITIPPTTTPPTSAPIESTNVPIQTKESTNECNSVKECKSDTDVKEVAKEEVHAPPLPTEDIVPKEDIVTKDIVTKEAESTVEPNYGPTSENGGLIAENGSSVESGPSGPSGLHANASMTFQLMVSPPVEPIEPLDRSESGWIEPTSECKDLKELEKPKLAREVIPHIASSGSMAMVIMTPLERFVNLHCQMVSESFPRKCIVADRQMQLYYSLITLQTKKESTSVSKKSSVEDIATTKEAMMISIAQLKKDCSSKMEKLKADNVKLQQQSRQSNAQLTHRITHLEGLIKTKDRQLTQCQKRLAKEYKCKRPQEIAKSHKRSGCPHSTRSDDNDEDQQEDDWKHDSEDL